jgi:hypothetical protein
MDRDELKRLAAARRSGEVPTKETLQWKCTYCERSFVRESAFMNHRCQEKLKIDQLRSPIGQAAYLHYSEWMKCQRHSVPPIETFAESRLYSTFIKFAEYAQKTHLPSVADFIKLMVQEKLSPTLWARDATYAMYLQKYDSIVSPHEQVARGLEELIALSAEMGVKLSKVFEALGPSDIIRLIQKRKLTFWLLMASGKFRAYLTTLPAEDRDRITAAMNAGAAVNRIQQEPLIFREIGSLIREAGL